MQRGQVGRATAGLGAIAITLLLAAGSSAATRQQVAVVQVGWGVGSLGYGVGARVVNRSKRDAFGVKVTLNHAVPGIGGLAFLIHAIPAGRSLVVAASFGTIPVNQAPKIEGIVRVRRMVRHARANRLLRISEVHIDQTHSHVTAVITNTLGYPINLYKSRSADAFAVVYDASGQIIGAGDKRDGFPPGSTLKPGRQLQVTINVRAPMDQVVRAQVSAIP